MGGPMLNLDLDQSKGRTRTAVLALLVPALLVLVLLLLIIAFRDGAEGAMARLADLLPVSYAFAAGMVASVNPCGVVMLPSYAVYQLGADDEKVSVLRRILRAVRVSIAVTLGFVSIFALVGVGISAGGRWLVSVFPYAGLVIALAMAGLGIWLLIGHKTLGIVAAGRVRLTPKRNLGNMFLFGIVYAVGSLSCTLPIFLVVVGSALAGGSLTTSFGQFLGYALGMGAVILVVTVGVALFRRAVARWLDRFTPYVHRFSALFLIGAGFYLVYYWIFVADLFSF